MPPHIYMKYVDFSFRIRVDSFVFKCKRITLHMEKKLSIPVCLRYWWNFENMFFGLLLEKQKKKKLTRTDQNVKHLACMNNKFNYVVMFKSMQYSIAGSRGHSKADSFRIKLTNKRYTLFWLHDFKWVYHWANQFRSVARSDIL